MSLAIKPAKRFLYMASVLVFTSLLIPFNEDIVNIWFLISGILIVVSIYDVYLLFRFKVPEISRIMPSAMPVGNWHSVKLDLNYSGKYDYQLKIFDHIPEQCKFNGLPITYHLNHEKQHYISEYNIKPVKRGTIFFGKIDCLVSSKLGLWYRRIMCGSESELHIYPDYKPVLEYALLATENRLSSMGILKQRRRGQGMEFHQMREYREGDNLKQIDWKVSSRMKKLIAREYQDERDQEIIFLMDCGHRMLSIDGELSHFDYILNSVLLMSYVALRQGDAVGIATFSHDSPRWIRPVKGVGKINYLLNGIYDLQPGVHAPDYIAGANFVLSNHRKRSLVIILSNLRDDDTDDLQLAVQMLKKRHKVIVASLQETSIHKILDQPVNELEDALAVSAAHGYLESRSKLIKLLEKHRIHTLDVLPQQLPLALTNAYLDLKVSGQV